MILKKQLDTEEADLNGDNSGNDKFYA